MISPKQLSASTHKLSSLLMTLLLLLTFSSEALAYVQFQQQFQKLYAGRENKDFRTVVRKAKCFVCHQGEDNDHKFNNRFGQALAPYLGEEDKKDKKKIIAALEKVVAMPVDATDPESKTFAELIQAGELPGGSLEDSKKDPEGAPTSELNNSESETE